MTLIQMPDAASEAGMITTKMRKLRELKVRLKRLLQKKDWSQQDLVRATGLTKDSISSYCNGHAFPRDRNLFKVAAALGVSPNDLVPGFATDTYDDKSDSELVPPYSLTILPGGGRAHLRVDRMISAQLAIKIVNLLQSETDAEAAAQKLEADAN